MEHLKVVLLRRVAKLGNIGDVVNVKPGFARNYLLPKKFALRATKENLQYFEEQRAKIEADNLETKKSAEKVAEKINGMSVILIRQASEKGQLYGSVTNRDIAASISAAGYQVSAGQINLNTPIKLLGLYNVDVELHPEVSVNIQLNVAKSEEEAQTQAAEAKKTA